MNDARPFSPACQRNQQPIFEALQQILAPRCSVLEIGSGTGQHASYFCTRRPGWTWQCSDRQAQLDGIRQWLADLPACPAPLALDVFSGPWPARRHDAVYTANTLHIMPWSGVEALFRRLPELLWEHGHLICYGPFKRDGQHTSASNAAFDLSLRQQLASQGIRDFEAVDALARQAGLILQQDLAMPANNRLLTWRRHPSVST